MMRIGIMATLLASLVVTACGQSGSSAARPESQPTGASGSAAGQPHLVEVVSGLDSPTQVIPMPDDRDHLWVLERRGTIRDVRDGRLRQTPVADLSAATRSGGEQGLLSLALHPNFPATDLAYIHRSDPDGDTLVTEHRVDAGTVTDEPTRVLLQVDQPYSNHNGGSVAFGPDGLLYLGLGDGGSGGDPMGNGQNLESRLGKLLRTDVGSEPNWEVAASGLRNPWRVTFDPETGDGWIGDVGQNAWEEVDRFPAGSPLRNYGWSVREGRHAYRDGGSRSLEPTGRLTEPVAEYSHADGCSITGGVVVRDPAVPALTGRYIYADFCSGTFWSIGQAAADTPRVEPFELDNVVSIDSGPDRRVYVTSIDGRVMRLTQPTGRSGDQ